MRPSVIKSIKVAGYDINFVLRLPWISIWILLNIVILPILSGLNIVSSDFTLGWYLSMIPMLMFTQKLTFTKLAQPSESK